jgi:excisionase family DNA binding protein
MTRTKNVAHKSAHKNAVLNHGEEKLLTTQDVSAYLNVSKRTVQRYVKAGKLQAFRLAGGGPFRFKEIDVNRLLIAEKSIDQRDSDIRSYIHNQIGG